jgi:serine/threonine protein kinase
VSSPSPAFGRWGHEFETLLELGQGGMATAYLARMLGPDHFQRLVVLKRLSLELSANSDAVSRFMAEARVGAQLHHSNVVGTHRIDRDAAGPFIVLEYVEGGSVDELLSASLARGRALPFRAVLRIGLDALAGLRAVHEATASNGRPLEILHRDVSMQNVLVGVHDGVARLSDFGVAKSRLSATRTEPGCLVGKILYMAPECLRYQPLGPTVDLYALGLTLWLALAGSDPWPDEDDVELARMIVHDGVPPLPARAGAPPEIVTIIARACALRAADRFQSAREMTLSLEPFRTAGLVASHEEVAALVSELLGDTLRSRRELLANLAPELGVSSLAVNHGALAPTVPARHFEPSPSPRAATAPDPRGPSARARLRCRTARRTRDGARSRVVRECRSDDFGAQHRERSRALAGSGRAAGGFASCTADRAAAGENRRTGSVARRRSSAASDDAQRHGHLVTESASARDRARRDIPARPRSERARSLSQRVRSVAGASSPGVRAECRRRARHPAEQSISVVRRQSTPPRHVRKSRQSEHLANGGTTVPRGHASANGVD